MPNEFVDTTPAEEVLRVLSELRGIGEDSNTIQDTLLSSMAGKLDNILGPDPDDDLIELAGEAAAMGAATAVEILTLTRDGLIFSDETMATLTPGEKLQVLLGSMAAIDDDEDEEEETPEVEGVLSELSALFDSIFGQNEEAQIGADSR